MHLPTFQCCNKGCDMNRKNLFTLWTISGLVKVIYCRAPIIALYRARSSMYSGPFRHSWRGVEMPLATNIPAFVKRLTDIFFLRKKKRTIRKIFSSIPKKYSRSPSFLRAKTKCSLERTNFSKDIEEPMKIMSST